MLERRGAQVGELGNRGRALAVVERQLRLDALDGILHLGGAVVVEGDRCIDGVAYDAVIVATPPGCTRAVLAASMEDLAVFDHFAYSHHLEVGVPLRRTKPPPHPTARAPCTSQERG